MERHSADLTHEDNNGGEGWTCQVCTLRNQTNADECEVCLTRRGDTTPSMPSMLDGGVNEEWTTTCKEDGGVDHVKRKEGENEDHEEAMKDHDRGTSITEIMSMSSPNAFQYTQYENIFQPSSKEKIDPVPDALHNQNNSIPTLVPPREPNESLRVDVTAMRDDFHGRIQSHPPKSDAFLKKEDPSVLDSSTFGPNFQTSDPSKGEEKITNKEKNLRVTLVQPQEPRVPESSRGRRRQNGDATAEVAGNGDSNNEDSRRNGNDEEGGLLAGTAVHVTGPDSGSLNSYNGGISTPGGLSETGGVANAVLTATLVQDPISATLVRPEDGNTNAGQVPNNQRWGRSFIVGTRHVALLAVLCFVLFLLAVGAAIGVTMVFLGRRNNEDDDNRPLNDDGNRKRVIRDFLINVSRLDLLDSLSTPQNRALTWLSDNDGATVSVENQDQIVQRYVLSLLYIWTKGDEWDREYSFLSSQHECNWNGIGSHGEKEGVSGCDSSSKITNLMLGENGLVRTIPSEIAHLTELSTLDLSGNSLGGNIPSEIGRMQSALASVQLGNNSLVGQIPSTLGMLSGLTTLILSNNNLVGTVPSELADLTMLEVLRLEGNEVTGNLTKLCQDLDSSADVSADKSKVVCPCCGCCSHQSALPSIIVPSLPIFSTAHSSLINETSPPTSVSSTPKVTAGPTSQRTKEPTQIPTWIPISKIPTLGAILPEIKLTDDPTFAPTEIPTELPTRFPTAKPTPAPTSAPTKITDDPTFAPTEIPTELPTRFPTAKPTPAPTSAPTKIPTQSPTLFPTTKPTQSETPAPARIPTRRPTWFPTMKPTSTPKSRFDTIKDIVTTAGGVNDHLPFPASDLLAFSNKESPQYRAANWIADEDDARLPVHSTFQGWSRARVIQRYSLAVLFFSTDGWNWKRRNDFLTGRNECEWGSYEKEDNDPEKNSWYGGSTGVEICDTLGRITVLSLGSNGLKGAVPREIGTLTELTRLDMGDNDLHGQVPGQIGQMSMLTHLKFNQNSLTGSIPTETGLLTRLVWLSYSNNGGIGGTIPSELGRLTRLEELFLWGNRLTGTIPWALGSLEYVKSLSLKENRLTGNIPSSLANLRSAQKISLQNNKLKGNVNAICDARLADLEKLNVDEDDVECDCC